MKTSRRPVLVAALVTVAFASWLAVVVGQQKPVTTKPATADALLGAAQYQEQIEGRLEAAIATYRKVLAAADATREQKARAQFRIGICYERLGLGEARKAYEAVVANYGDQADLTAQARTRLAAMEGGGGLGHPPGITLRRVWALSEYGWLKGSPSPDGRYYSFADPDTGDLFLRDLATGENRRVTNEGNWNGPGVFAETSVISGDGRQIAYAFHNKENYYELRVIGIDGANPRTVYRDKEYGFWLEPYQWTADGKQILAALMKAKKEWRLALIPVAGGPIKVLRTHEHGAWHPSLSPDQRFLVYAAWKEDRKGAGDIFVLSLEDGQEVPLVQSPAEDVTPVWAPDGKKILFVSDRTGTRGFWAIDVANGKPQGIPRLVKDGVTGVGGVIQASGFTRQGAFYYSTSTSIADVYVTQVDPVQGKVLGQPVPAAPRFVGSNSAPSWSPDGRRLAYYRRGDTYEEESPTLVILSVETGEARDIPVNLDQFPLPVLWLPDGKSVFVGALDSPKPGLNTTYRVDVQTGDHHVVRSFPRPVPGAGDISPDGKTLFFFTRDQSGPGIGLISCDIETQQEREIARVPDLARGGFPKVKVSPDGKHLALRLPVDGNKRAALRLVPATGGEWRELCRFPKSETDDSWDLAWTPDGRNLLIVRPTGKDDMPELWRAPITGGELQRMGLSMEGMRYVSLHPAGRRIAFDSGSRSGSPNELWVLENFLPGLRPAR